MDMKGKLLLKSFGWIAYISMMGVVIFLLLALVHLALPQYSSILTPVIIIVVVGIFLIVAIMDYLKSKAKTSEQMGDSSGELFCCASEALQERLAQVERQLVDVQEIVLAIDEKLERQEPREQG